MAKKKSIDEILEAFDQGATETKIRDGCTLTFWVSPEIKKKYEIIQRRSKRRFSRVLKEVIEESIQRIDCDDGPSIA